MYSDLAAQNREAHIHYIVAFIGGFLGIFPIVNAAHFLGSAQTSNLIDIVLSSLRSEWHSLRLHLLGAFLYCLAIFLATFLPKHTKLNVKICAMAFDAACSFVLWLFPTQKNLPLTVYLYPTFFAMSFQWCAFKGAYGFVSATIFSTNNLRQFVSAMTEIFCNGDKNFSLKAKFFGGKRRVLAIFGQRGIFACARADFPDGAFIDSKALAGFFRIFAFVKPVFDF